MSAADTTKSGSSASHCSGEHQSMSDNITLRKLSIPTVSASLHASLPCLSPLSEEQDLTHKIGTVFEISGANCTLALLIVDEVLAAGVIIETRTDSNGAVLSYIAQADSTGYGRGGTGEFFAAVVRKAPGRLACFSHPRNELLFGGSARNPDKRLLGARHLLAFWRRVLSAAQPAATLLEWSNLSSRRKHPYKRLKDVVYFWDDPKRKLRAPFTSVGDLFEGLLVRADFAQGALLYTVSKDQPLISQPTDSRASNAPIAHEDTCSGPGTAHSDNTSDPSAAHQHQEALITLGRIHDVVHALRTADFSTKQRARHATAVILAAFPATRTYCLCRP